MSATLKEQILRALKKGPMHPGQIADEIGVMRKRVTACIRDIRENEEGVIYVKDWIFDRRARIAIYDLGGMLDAPMEDVDDASEPKVMQTLGNLGKATKHLENVSKLWRGLNVEVGKAEESVRRVPEVTNVKKNFRAEILRIAPKGMTRQEIADALGCGRKNEMFVDALNKLLDDGILTREGSRRLHSMKKGL